MSSNKLTNIQWQYIRQYCQVSVVSVSVIIFLLYFLWKGLFEFTALKEWLVTHFSQTIPPLPQVFLFVMFYVVFLIAAVTISVISGYIHGNLLKKRLEILLQSTLKIERGNLSIRIPDLGEDEIGQLGKHINEMTARFQQQVSSLQKLSAHNAELNEQVKEAAIIEERGRLARELHDAVSQQLFAISMTMAALKRTIVMDRDKASKQAALVEDMATQAQSEMRALLLHLRPARLEGKTLKVGIMELLQEFQTKHDLKFNVDMDELPQNITKGIEDHLFRILQESLSNILRHSKAKRVEVFLKIIEDQIRLKITDDGIGFMMDEQKSSSYGLSLMKERAAEIGGIVDISTAPQQGTMIQATVPLVLQKSEGK